MPVGRVGHFSRGRVQHKRRPLETPEEQRARAGRSGWEESSSGERLRIVWAEHDSEEGLTQAAELMAYKFRCSHCPARFSLAQQLEAHEGECGKMNSGPANRTAESSSRVLKCKYCGKPCQGFGEYGTHRWADHREEVLADLKRSRAQRKVDEAKIDAAIAKGDHGGAAGAPAASIKSTVRRPVENGHLCPTCGGAMPETAAKLFTELKGAGFQDADALEALRIARRVLGPPSERT